MADIQAKPNQEVDISGVSHAASPSATDPSGATAAARAQALGTAVDAGISVFQHRQKKQAEADAEVVSKSLLEEFTGFGRKQELNEQLDDAFDAEEEQRDVLGNAVPGSLERDISSSSLATIEKTKDTLEREKAAVDQGLLSLEEYRRRAESLFYQQVVQTPGLKTEIATVMTEYLGIDPRGQTAAIEIENRKAAAKAAASANTKLKGQMIGDGYWVGNKTDEWNFANLGQANLDYRQALKRMEFRQARLNFIQDRDKFEREKIANQTLQDLNTVQSSALRKMGEFGELNVTGMTYAQIRDMSPDSRDLWIKNIEQTAQGYKDVVTAQTFQNDQIGDRAQPLLDSIDARRDMLIGILKQDGTQELLEQQLARLNTLNDITVQSFLNSELLTDPEAVALAAMREVWGETNLTNKVLIERVSLRLMRGQAPDLSGQTTEERADTLSSYEEILKSTAKALDFGIELDEPQIQSLVKQLGTMSRHMPDEFNSEVRQQMSRLAANEEFMKIFEKNDPRAHANFTRSMIGNQKIELQSLQQDMQNMGVRGSQYFLQEEEGTWMITPTTHAVNKFVEGATLHGLHGQVTRKGSEDDALKFYRSQVQPINSTRGLLTNMVDARALAEGVSTAEAARMVATELGLNIKDVQEVVKEDKPGFGEEFQSKKPAFETPQEIDMNALSIEELNALSDASQAAVMARNARAE
jgi:hypothetical protein